MTQQDKSEALQEIVSIARAHGLSQGEITRALQDSGKKASSSVLSRLLGYIGGIFVLAGICIFISMQWSDMGAAARVVITLGSGFTALLMALAALGDEKYERAATPLFLIAAGLEAVGIMVMLKEYGNGGDARHGALFMTVVMLIQQGLLFAAKERPVLAFTSLIFGSLAFAVAGDLLNMPDNLVVLVLGAALICISFAADKTKSRDISPFWYMMGGICLLFSAFDILQGSLMEPLYVGLAAALIYLSTTVRSRTLLAVSTLGMLGYIGYFTAKHFTNTLGWPISLVLIGLCLILLGALAVKLNNKYIREVE